MHLDPWLTTASPTGDLKDYRHTLVLETAAKKSEKLDELKHYVQKAHEDARNRIRRVYSPTLDPFGSSVSDPAMGYPDKLHPNNLKGYFGEVLAARFVEYGEPHGITGWVVPSFPFQHHTTAITAILEWKRTGRVPSPVPGQDGDDCVAFLKDKDGKIVRCVVCESKCTATYNRQMMKDAHSGISRHGTKPASTWKIIDALEANGDAASKEWADLIRRDVFLPTNPAVVRDDLVMFICGQPPKKRKSWIPADKALPLYTGKRALHVVEVVFSDVERLIKDIYNG